MGNLDHDITDFFNCAMTVLMPSWYYEKKDLKRTPSILDGLDIERENRYRREGARFIINVGTKMGLRYDTMATGVVYFHRFYMFHTFKTFPRYVTACCCLFLAGKVEETPKKCKDIIRNAKTFLADNQFAQFGDDPKEEVMTLERILLQTIKFDLQVDHPYGHLLKYAKCLKGDKQKLQNMVQMAWTFINDSLCTTLCLQWEPEVIAIALMYLAGKLSKFEVVDWISRSSRHSHWWDMFVEGMSIELLEDICHQVLDLYSTPMSSTPQDSPPATPPTKSTRKTSQPPSPIETSTSPAQQKPKDPPVGLPIPRLEPGELKRKATHEPKKEIENKIPRTTIEAKSIPIISSSTSPKLPKKPSIIKGPDTQPSSPTSPNAIETVSKLVKHTDITQRSTLSDATFRSGISSTSNTQPYPQSASVMPTENIVIKPSQHVTVTTNFSLSLPPPTATYTQSAPPFYTAVASATASENQVYPNMQQPPPQIFTQQPLQFQHPPPTVAPSASLTGISRPPPQYGEAPHQFPNLPPGTVPPFNSQFPPPPPPIRPPPNVNNPPPAPLPGITQHPPPPVSGMMRNPPPPPPPGVTSRNTGGPPPTPHGVQSRTTGAPPPPPGISARNAGAPPPPPGISPRNAGVPPPPPGVGPRNSGGPHMLNDNLYGPRPNSEVYHPRQEGRGALLQHEHRLSNRDFAPRGSFDDSARFRRRNPDFDSPYQNKPPFPEFDQGFHRPPRPNQFGTDFERSMPPRGFPRNLQQLRNPGPRPRMMNNMPPQPGTPTGIPPVRITGSM